MQGAYIRSFSPNIKHVLSCIFLIIAVILFIIGAVRASRVSYVTVDESGFTFDSDEIKEKRNIVFKPEILEASFKMSDSKNPVVCATVSTGIINDYDIFIVPLGCEYRFLAVKINSDEYQKVLDGEEITAYFSDKYSKLFTDYVAKMDGIYDSDEIISPSECSTLGLIAVDPQKESMSFLWGLPFLIIGLFLLKLAGNPFFYFPEESTSD